MLFLLVSAIIPILDAALIAEVSSGRPTIVGMNTTATVQCTVSVTENTATDQEIAGTCTWNKQGDDEELMVDAFTMESQAETYTSALTVTAEDNFEDARYVCSCEISNRDGDKAAASTVALMFLFIATPIDAEVKKGEDATLSCVFTDIIKNLTVTWERGGVDVMGIPKHTVVTGFNIGGREESVLTVEEVEESTNYTCSLYPYQDLPWRTSVSLLVTDPLKNGSPSSLLTLPLVIALPEMLLW